MDESGDIMRLCRLCLVKEQVNIPIFEDQGDIRQIFLKISSCLPVKVSRDDKLPKNICDGCSGKLDLLYDFWNTSANAEKTLLSWLGEAGIKEQDVEDKLSAVQQIHHESKGIVKQETVDATDDNFFSNFDNNFEDTKTKVRKVTKKEKDVQAPPPKRARRTAAVKAQINISRDSDDDDDMDVTEPLTKIEDESDSDADPSYSEVPGTSADDDQPGPSGMSKDGVEAPVKEVRPRKIYFCKICNKRFVSRKKLERHLEVLVMKPQFFCRHCAKVVCCSNEDATDPEYAGAAVLCGVCNSILERENILAPSCFHDEVDFNGENEKQLDMSLLNTMNDISEEYDDQPRPPKVQKPKRTKEERISEMKKFFEENGIEDVEIDDNEKPTECTICHIFFKSMQEKRRHKKMYHKVIQICPLCGYTTPHASSFSRHMFNHRNERNVKCDICFKGFNTRHALKRHKLVHDEIGKHQCAVCGKTFKKRYNLNVHTRIHTDDKPYECLNCDKTFRTKQSRDNHARSHKECM